MGNRPLPNVNQRAKAPLEILRCPRCGGGLEGEAAGLACGGCGAALGRLPGGAVDFVPEVADDPGLAQRTMEAPAIAQIYEGYFRPGITRLGGGPSYREEVAYLERWFAPGKGPMLDLACGTGRYTRWLAARIDPARIVAVDLSAPMLRIAAGSIAGPTFLRASAQALPIASGALGAAISFGALHLFPDPAGALAEVGRALAPGGRLVCLTCARVEGVMRGPQRVFTRATRLRFVGREEVVEGLARGGMALEDWSPRGNLALFAALRR